MKTDDKTQKWLEAYRKREKRCARDLKCRALLCIDHLIPEFESTPLLDKIYRIAHSATDVCDADHEDWVKEINETYKKLKGER